jgi:DNA-binding MarR family transcriptional regulator
MACRKLPKKDRDTSALCRNASKGLESALSSFGEATLDQLLADPIVGQLMRRDRTDEMTVRSLLNQAAVVRSTTVAGDDPNAFARRLQETALLWISRFDRALRTKIRGMTRARCSVLIYLAQHKGLNQVALAQSLDVRPTTLGRTLDRLEADGFIARLPDTDDRRAHVLKLTAAALPVIESVFDLVREIYSDLRHELSTANVGQPHEPI